MKNKYTLLTLALASLTVTVNPVMAADETSDVIGDRSWSSAFSGDVTRVPEDYLDQITTAKNIIDCSVYDEAGEKIGDVKDISLGFKLHSMAGIQANDKTDGQTSKYAIGDKKDPDNIYNSIGHNASGMANNNPTPYVFISVGGLMGLGDDVVRVPLRSLSRSDKDKNHLVLQRYSKDKVVAIAKLDPKDFDTKDYEYDHVLSATSRSKIVWADSFDTTNTRKALIAEDRLGATDADRIIVGRDGENVILSGSLNTETQKKKAGDITKKNTEMPVKNQINVNQK